MSAGESASRLAPAPSRSSRRTPRSRKAATAAATATTTRPAAAARAITFPFVPIIRLVVLVWIVSKAASYAMTVPEVRTAIDAALRGDTPAVTEAVDALRSRVEAALQDVVGGTTSGPPAETPQRLRRVPPPPPPPALKMPDESTTPVAIAPNAIGSTAPRAIRRVPHVYTDAARRERIEGSVLLRALVEPDGRVANVTVVRSLDDTHGLDEQAVNALRQWLFEPAHANGRAVSSWVEVEMSFTLR